MKKYIISLVAIMLCVLFVACGKQSDNTQTTTQPRSTSTTAPVKSDDKNGLKLKKAVISAFELAYKDGQSDDEQEESTSKADDGKKLEELYDITGDIATGSFELKLKEFDQNMYANEASEEMKAKSLKVAQKFADKLKGYYPDEITLESCDIVQIGSGDNGVDSCYYLIIFTNTQNQALEIRTDSNAKIFYVKSTMTW